MVQSAYNWSVKILRRGSNSSYYEVPEILEWEQIEIPIQSVIKSSRELSRNHKSDRDEREFNKLPKKASSQKRIINS